MTISQSVLTSRPAPSLFAQEIDVELFTFIERYATNLVRWDLLILFGQRPSMNGDAAQIASRIRRTTRSVQKELNDLVYLGVLRAQLNEGGVHYALTRSPYTRRAVMRFARDYKSMR